MILKTENGPIYYEVSGDGPPLVFVSGWAMSCECWRPAVAILEQKYRCLIYDSRGIARSQPASVRARFGVEDHAEDLHRTLEVTNIFDAVIIGHEIGSVIAAYCADAHPQDLRSAILVSPRAGMSPDDVRRLAVYTPASLALRELAAFPLIRNLVARRFRRAPQPYRDALFNDFAYLSPRAAYETALSASAHESADLMERQVGRMSSPVLFICGEKDKKGAAEARRLFSFARAGKLATMRDCGFLPMLEFPRQFSRLVDQFVTGPRRVTAGALSLR
ncbi:MAG TPA: alpha/beta hydrolase [Blastocatellia bacterium]|jgi:pimeloyl-ACP methyl ester carboxylesterase|nr:alpha/beta hydrolase [Blastocatellia bacterium]